MSDTLVRRHVMEVCAYRRPGDELVVHGDFRDRIGHVLACAREAHAAARVRRGAPAPADEHAAPLAGAGEAAA